MATSKSKGELVIPIISVQSSLLLGHPFVPKIVHVARTKVTVNLMTCASLEQPVDQKTALLSKPVRIVMSFFQKLIVVSTWDLQLCLLLNFHILMQLKFHLNFSSLVQATNKCNTYYISSSI